MTESNNNPGFEEILPVGLRAEQARNVGMQTLILTQSREVRDMIYLQSAPTVPQHEQFVVGDK